MEKFSFSLDVFEGPLDVLLNLITKHKLNIFDIEISVLLEQYMKFMEEAHERDMELAGEFLEMAARLIYMKTAYLLPQKEEAEKMKKELEGALIELSLCKEAAARLSENFVGGDIFVREPMKIESDSTYRLVHEPDRLVNSYMNAVSNKKIHSAKNRVNIENKINSVVKRRIVPVLTKVVHILRELYTTGEVYMDKLYEGVDERSAKVATFLAVLELTKYGRIKISDDNTKVFFSGGRRRKWKSKKNSEQ
ncbi:MAG: segregation/condensation protein A [Ruminococcus sp.]|nr:segregation/condensation protein A [Ruminococcus sp.]